MNQIPNIEETHNTREVEDIKAFYSTEGIPEETKQAISFMRQWLNEDRKATPLVTAKDLWHWIGPTIHHQLQKARRKAKLEGYAFATRHFKERLEIGQSFADAVTGMEKLANHSELDQDDEDKLFQASSAGDILKELDQDKK